MLKKKGIKKEMTINDLAITMSKGFKAIDLKFEKVDKKLDAMDKKFVAIDKKFDVMNKKFDAIDSKFDFMDKKFDEKIDNLAIMVQTGFMEVHEKIDDFKVEVDKRFDYIQNVLINRHERRIEKLEDNSRQFATCLKIKI
jgi:hypothetical protein